MVSFCLRSKAKVVRVEDDMMASERVKLEQVCMEQEMLNQGISEECITVRRLGTVLNRGSIVIDYNEVCWRVQCSGTDVVYWTLLALGLVGVWFCQTKVLR